jgi:DNA-binding CsgD family transcriptional regulator
MLAAPVLFPVHGDPGTTSARRVRELAERRTPRDPDALEHAIVLCLVSFARLVSASGEAELLGRLCAALEQFGIDPDSCGVEPTANPRRSRRIKPRPGGSPLSGREHEVSALIAEGLTNREIAEALVISERTADTHVQNILGKLGLVSRAQVAAWFVEQVALPHRLRAERPKAVH